MTRITEPGVYQMDPDEYHADPCVEPSLSSTIARHLLRSPAHAWHAMHARKDSKAFDIGRAAHRKVLGAGSTSVIVPDEICASNGAWSTKETKAFIADAREQGMTPLRDQDATEIASIRDATLTALDALGIALDPNRSELAAFGRIGPAWCRAMIDNAPADPSQPLYDFKTCQSATVSACIKSIEDHGYDVQAAHYLETWQAATGESRSFRFVFCEKTPPYGVLVVQLMDDADDERDWMSDAREKTAQARSLWVKCSAANHWPNYPPMIVTLPSRGFHRDRWASRPPSPTIRPKPSAAALRAARDMQSPMEAEK